MDIDEIEAGYSPEFLAGDMSYKDIDGNDRTLWQMVRNEPQWTEGRFRLMERDISALIAMVRALEADNAGLVVTLNSIANSTCCGDCQEAKRVAISALAKHGGQK